MDSSVICDQDNKTACQNLQYNLREVRREAKCTPIWIGRTLEMVTKESECNRQGTLQQYRGWQSHAGKKLSGIDGILSEP